MAGSFSDYTEDAVLDHILKNDALSQPTHIYVALFTVAPTDAGGGTEVSGGGYARKQHDTWDAASGGASENTGAITFDQASGDWGECVAFALFDALSGGNMLPGWADLSASKTVNSGDTAEFADGDLDLSLN